MFDRCKRFVKTLAQRANGTGLGHCPRTPPAIGGSTKSLKNGQLPRILVKTFPDRCYAGNGDRKKISADLFNGRIGIRGHQPRASALQYSRTILPRCHRSAIKGRESICPSAVAGENDRRRIEFPSRLGVVAPASGQFSRVAGGNGADPEFSFTDWSLHKRNPASVRRHSLISSISASRSRNAVYGSRHWVEALYRGGGA